MSGYFIPLGGGNEVGASAYFLSIDGIRILLDCGARLKGEELYPDYECLLGEISDFSEIDIILISHGHYDHIGSFTKIAAKATNAEIITTNDTRSLIVLQLLEFGRISGRVESERIKNEKYRQAQAVMSRIHTKPVMKTFEVRGCKITFMPAGHMMGAVMIYLESRNHKVLYSGDFSVRTMFGLNGMNLLNDIRPNVLLLNAPNVYLEQEEWKKLLLADEEQKSLCEKDQYSWLENIIRKNIDKQRKVYLISRSIPKHLDLFYFLKSVFPDVPVVLEPKSRQIADALSDMGYHIYGENILTSDKIPENGCIIVGQELERHGCTPVPFDGYSLHASQLETLEFVERVGAENIYLLHVYPNARKKSLKDILEKRDGKIVVTQAVNGSKYYIKRENKMVHEKIFQEIMQKALVTAQEQRGTKTRLSAEWAAIYGSLLYPDQHPKSAYQSLQKTFVSKYQITYDEYMEALKSANLDWEEKRKYVLSVVEHGMSLLKKALDGDRAAIEKYAEFTDNLELRDRKSRKVFFIGKCIVSFMVLIDPDLQKDEYKPIVITFGANYCNRLLKNIRDRLLREYNMTRRKKTARDVLRKTEEALSESSEAAAGFNSGDELEQLRFMNNNYKNSLELVQAMLDELNETIDETAADAKNAAIASFYSNMNSEEYGNLLDSIELVDRRLIELKENKVKVPPQLLPLTIVFKQLLRFVKACGISPIDTTGREFETEVEGLAEYTYIGEPYSYPGEKKVVVVERPGWKFDSVVISLPTVREKEEEGV